MRKTVLLILSLAVSPVFADETAPAPDLVRALKRDIALRNEEFAREPANIADKEWVKRKLAHMFAVDQAFRFKIIAARKQPMTDDERKALDNAIGPAMLEMDREYTGEMKALLKLYPWFTISAFGAEADNHAWILVQHADRDVEFQKRVLTMLESLYRGGETNPRNYAYLVDRVAMNEQRPQRYGTQGRCTQPSTWEPFPMDEPDNVDNLRQAVGLEALAEHKRLVAQQCP
jgi:hypothetical protein